MKRRFWLRKGVWSFKDLKDSIMFTFWKIAYYRIFKVKFNFLEILWIFQHFFSRDFWSFCYFLTFFEIFLQNRLKFSAFLQLPWILQLLVTSKPQKCSLCPLPRHFSILTRLKSIVWALYLFNDHINPSKMVILVIYSDAILPFFTQLKICELVKHISLRGYYSNEIKFSHFVVRPQVLQLVKKRHEIENISHSW